MGKTFSDTAGKKWIVEVNVSTLSRVKTLCGVNLVDLFEPKSTLNVEMSTDPILLCNVLFAIVKPEADVKKITDEQFGSALGGDSISEAMDALTQALIDFFPKARREMLTKIFDRAKAIQGQQEAEVERVFDAILDGVQGSLVGSRRLSGAAPESAEPIREASLSASS